MSASRERKKRAVLAESGQSPKQIKAAQEKKRKTHRRTVGIIALVLALAIGIGLFYGLVVRPKALPKKTVALRTGDHELSAVEFSHYYYDAINSFYQNYGSYLTYFMSDPSQPIDQQVYDQETGETWAEYFKKSAADTAKFDYAVYDEAKAAGYTLSAESEQAIQDSIKTLETQVKENGFKSIDQYFDQVYGKGCSKNSYLAYQRIRATASEYSKKLDDEREFSDADIQAKDDENPAKYSNATYRSFFLSAGNYKPEAAEGEEEKTEEEQAAETKQAMADAKADADKMVAASTSEKAFTDMALELATEGAKQTYENPDATLNAGVSYDNANTVFSDWLFDSARKAGDVASFADGENGYYVVYFLSTDDNNYNTVNVRHILITPENDEDSDNDGTPDKASDAADAAAKEKAEKILADWKAGDATEDSFAALAKENSSDNADDGGLYEDVYKGQMVAEFEDWCYDPARKAGDTGIVKTTYGYHIMYFVGEGENYRRHQILHDLKDAAYDEWAEKIVEGKDAVLDEAGTKFLRTDLVLGSNEAAAQ